MKRIVFLLLIIFATPAVQAQPRDSVFQSKTIHHPIRCYPPLTDTPVMWSKRIVRYIDVKDSNNLRIFPLSDLQKNEAFLSSLTLAVKNGTVTTWSIDSPIALKTLCIPQTISESPTLLPNDAKSVAGYLLLEDWFFDREHSVMDVKPQAIMVVLSDSTKTEAFLPPLFAVYYPDALSIFQQLGCDEAFRRRMFSSKIYAESNLYDRLNEQRYRFAGLESDCRSLRLQVLATEDSIYTF